MALSKNLQSIRKTRGLRQEQLAEKAGVSLTQISKIERDEADPRVSTVEKLAKALECSTSKLLFNEDGEGIDGLLKRSFERIQKLTPRDKAAILKVMNMACAGGTVMKSFDEMYEDAE
jgi:transcriptional regulator with XRE-family HTH domain